MSGSLTAAKVVVVGAGISGVACARALQAAGVDVEVLDRGHRIGGRMASKRLEDRQVDLGAAYFTVGEGDGFAEVVAGWERKGLAVPWTDTVEAVSPGSAREPKPGPVRWRAPGSLRSLVEDLADGLPLRRAAVGQVDLSGDAVLVDGEPVDAVVLAMPDSQARTLLGPGLAAVEADLTRSWDPVLAVVLRWPERLWDLDFCFVNDHEVLASVADDGRRRGDGAPVLVAHTTSAYAAGHLVDPDAGGPAVTEAVRGLLGLPEPESVLVKRWSLAQPAGSRAEPYLLHAGRVGVCGDGWGEKPCVGTAWRSGHLLGQAMAEALAGR